MSQVPQPSNDALDEDDKVSLYSVRTPPAKDSDRQPPSLATDRVATGADVGAADASGNGSGNGSGSGGPLSGFFNLFRSHDTPKPPHLSNKQMKILKRGQTVPLDESQSSSFSSISSEASGKPSTINVTSGHDLDASAEVTAPPKTTFFEAAGDILNPSIPSVDFLIDPTKRPRTIFHDRVYHPLDIPPPPLKKRSSLLAHRKSSLRTSSGQLLPSQSGGSPSSPSPPSNASPSMKPVHDKGGQLDATNGGAAWDRQPGDAAAEVSGMRVEEKIARAYHRGLSWRKVLVKLEPDAHNNMIVRRMFANAYGWPVMKHLVDAHFSDSAVARMRTEDEYLGERARATNRPPDEDGTETKPLSKRSQSLGMGRRRSTAAKMGPEAHTAHEAREALDEVGDLPGSRRGDLSPCTPRSPRSPLSPRTYPADSVDSATCWSEGDWDDSEDDSESEAPAGGLGRGGPRTEQQKPQRRQQQQQQ